MDLLLNLFTHRRARIFFYSPTLNKMMSIPEVASLAAK